MSSYSRQQLEDWVRTIDVKSDRVLDIGGSQNPITKRVKSWKILKKNGYFILDLEVPHECKQKPDIVCDLNSFCLDINNIAHREPPLSIEELKRYNNYFDVAFCLEVSEYWWNPIQALSNIHYLLKQNGILYISFHQVYPVHNPVEQDYLRYTPEGIKKILKETGFEVIEMLPRLITEDITRIDGMRPAKNYNKHNWSGSLVKCKKV